MSDRAGEIRVRSFVAPKRRETLWIALLSGILAVVMTWPLVPQFFTHVPGTAGNTDVDITLWDFWWFQNPLQHWFPHLFRCSYVYHPLGVSLAYHGTVLLYALVALPVSWLLGIMPAVNLVTLLTFVTSAVACYWLCRRLGLERHAATVAALLFAFSPYRLWRMQQHTCYLATDWVAAYALCLMVLLDTRRVFLTGLLAGVCMACCLYCDYTFAVLLVILTCVYVLVFFCPWRDFGQAKRVVLGLTVAAAAAAAMTFPVLWALSASRANFESYVEGGNVQLSADLLGFIKPPAPSVFGRLLAAEFAPIHITQEGTTFVGFLALVLALLALFVRTRDKRLRFWKIALLVFFVLSLGPFLKVGGDVDLFELNGTFARTPFRLTLPYAFLTYVPIVNNARAPARFHAFTTLPLCVLAGVGLARLTGRMQNARWKAVAATLAATVSLAEYAVFPIATYQPNWKPFDAIAKDPDNVSVLDDVVNGRKGMLHQVRHGKRIVAGHVGRVPPDIQAYMAAAPLLREFAVKDSATPRNVEAYRKAPGAAAMTANILDLLDLRYFVINGPDEQFKRRLFDGLVPYNLVSADDKVEIYELAPPRRAGLRPRHVAVGEGEWSIYLGRGWGQWWRETKALDGRKAIWPASPMSTFLFKADRPQPVHFEADVYMPKSSRGVRLEVLVNGASLGVIDHFPEGVITIEVRFPESCVKRGLNEVEFRWPFDPRTPVWGGYAGALSEIFFAAATSGQNPNTSVFYLHGQPLMLRQRGYWLIELSDDAGKTLRESRFDPYDPGDSWSNLISTIKRIPQGRLVAFLSSGEASKGMTPAAVQALGELGSAFDMCGKTGWCHAGIGIKGLSPGQAIEDTGIGTAIGLAPSRCAFLEFRLREADGPTQ